MKYRRVSNLYDPLYIFLGSLDIPVSSYFHVHAMPKELQSCIAPENSTLTSDQCHYTLPDDHTLYDCTEWVYDYSWYTATATSEVSAIYYVQSLQFCNR